MNGVASLVISETGSVPSAELSHSSLPPQRRILLTALVVAMLLCIAIASVAPARHVLLFLTGAALGAVLYQSVFGFTSAFRVLLADRRSAGFRAQMVMLGVACALFFPVLTSGTLWGQPVAGFVSPVGVSVMVGAFMFGIGMTIWARKPALRLSASSTRKADVNPNTD